jgi:beta-glucosidase
LRKASGEAVVLLKNDKKLLPIRQGQAKKIALIGRGAKYPAPSGGGSASLTSSYTVSPLEAISAAAEEQGSSVQWLLGAEAQLYVPLATPYLRGPSLKPQIKMEVWLRDNAPSRDWLSETAGLSPKSKPDYTKDDLKDAFLFLMEGEFLEMAIPDMWSRVSVVP